MKTVFIYFLSLTLLLLVGYRFVNRDHHAAKTAIQSLKMMGGDKSGSHITKATTVNNKLSVLGVEYEYEDTTFDEKLMSLSGYFVAICFAAFILPFLNAQKKRVYHIQRFTLISPQKYILQGAMRI